VESYEGQKRKSKPGGQRLVPSPHNYPGRKSYRRKGGEAELAEQKRLPSSNNQQKRAATDQKHETRKGRRLRLETLNSFDERTSAFRHLERLNEQRELINKVPCERAVSIDRACPKTNDAGSPKGQAKVEAPTKLAMV
jgi:hypothetical protein